MRPILAIRDCFKPLTALLGLAAFATNIHAMSFGSDGRDGSSGAVGRAGRSGQSLSIKAEGAAANYDISGLDGGDAGPGEPGYSATGCSQPFQPSYSLEGASGGAGGQGGSGGQGGNGGALTVYYTDINHLKFVSVRGRPGEGGRSGWGGRGGDECRCNERQWTVAEQTYTCNDGQRGRDSGPGNAGSRGSYGQVMLVSQLQPVAAELPSVYVDMSKMEDGPIRLSKNLWEQRQQARQLFAPGTDIADRYFQFISRSEVEYQFKWEAPRPITDFRGWQMLLRLEGNRAKLDLPQQLWLDGEETATATGRLYTIRGAVSTGELGNIQFEGFFGDGANHVIAIQDNAHVSNILQSAVRLKYYVYENGSYQVRYDADVPAAALSRQADGFDIAMGGLGLDPKYLKLGTQAYADLLVTRSLGANSTKYTLGSYYTIQLQLRVNDAVEPSVDSDMFYGNQVVGRVLKGEKFKVANLQGDWVALKKLDGTAVPGWISLANVVKSAP